MLQNSKPTRYGSKSYRAPPAPGPDDPKRSTLSKLREAQLTGIYVPKGQRLQQKKVIEAAHFTLGDALEIPKVSVSHAMSGGSHDF